MFLTGLRRGCSLRTSLVWKTSCHYSRSKKRCFAVTGVNNNKPPLVSEDIDVRPPLPTNLPRRIAFGSCADQTEDLSAYDRIHKAQPDLLLLLGDNVYGGKSLDSLQQAYKMFGAHPSVQNVLQHIPILPTLDDNDYCSSQFRDEAKELFLDFFQIPFDDPRRTPLRGSYTSCVWGGTKLQILLLDVRYHASEFQKRVEHCEDRHRGPYISNDDCSKTLLGPEQWDWLETQLMQTEAEMRLVVSPIQVLTQSHSWDGWDLFPNERARLLDLLERTSGKKLILSGDRHVGGYYRSSESSGLVEVTSSSLTHSVPHGLLDHEVDASCRIGNLVHDNNFGIVEIDPETNRFEVSLCSAKTGEPLVESIVI
jgi:alkaline phosphatase D